MEFELTPAQQRLKQQLHRYVQSKITPELEAELDIELIGGRPAWLDMMKDLGKNGWLGIGWPKEYGGQGRSPIEQYIFFDLTNGYHRIPLPFLSLNTVGPTIMRVGTEEQKKRFLPPILKGEMFIAIGYTEPEAGTDLASLKTTAVRDGDDYVINGQKVFTSEIESCQYVWLAARTDPSAPKHKGISMFMVDTQSPGLRVEPIRTLGFRTNYTFYDNVRVPKECLVGEENKGWSYINNQLALERISLVCHSHVKRTLDDTVAWARETKLNGATVIGQAWVKNKLAEMAVDTEALRLLNYRVAWLMAQGIVPHAESAMTKVFGAEAIQRSLGTSLQIMGLYGQLQTGSKRAPIRGRIEQFFRTEVVVTFGGGAAEVLREIVAMAGLGLPRSR